MALVHGKLFFRLHLYSRRNNNDPRWIDTLYFFIQCIGILPGSTQEAVFNDRLKSEGMTLKDIKSVRVSFSEMAGALERGDHYPSLDLAMRICDVFGLPIEAVFSRTEFTPMSAEVYRRNGEGERR